MTDKIVILSACGSFEEARSLARAIVTARLAACVNIVPNLHSVYRWKGAIEEAQEYLLVIKSRTHLLDAVKSELRRLHSYELPEVISLPVLDGLPEYLAWIEEETVPVPQ